MDELSGRIIGRIGEQENKAIKRRAKADAEQAAQLEKRFTPELSLGLALLDVESRLAKIKPGERRPSKLSRTFRRFLGRSVMKPLGVKTEDTDILFHDLPLDVTDERTARKIRMGVTHIFGSSIPMPTNVQRFKLPTDDVETPNDRPELIIKKHWLFEFHRTSPESRQSPRLVVNIFRCGEGLNTDVTERNLYYSVRIFPSFERVVRSSSHPAQTGGQPAPPQIDMTSFTNGEKDNEMIAAGKREEAIYHIMGLLNLAEQSL